MSGRCHRLAAPPVESAAESLERIRREERRRLHKVQCHACLLHEEARALDAQCWALAETQRRLGSKDTMVGAGAYAFEPRPPSEFRRSPAVELLRRHRFDKRKALAAALAPKFRRTFHVAGSKAFGLDARVAGRAYDRGVFTFDTAWAVFLKDLEWSDWPAAAVGWVEAKPMDERARRRAWRGLA